MHRFKKIRSKTGKKFYKKYVRFSHSIYGRVVLLIMILSIFLFASFSIIFKSVNEEYLNAVIRQSGSNVGFIVEGALYHSMLANDKSSLQSTLDVINALPGIEEVNMYDGENRLVYTSIPSDTNNSHGSPDCISCHPDFRKMFPGKEKSYRIIDEKSVCRMVQKDESCRHLLIRSPILNEKACYMNECHAHQPTDTLLGSLIIKVPLTELDAAVAKSSFEFYLIAVVATVILMSILIYFTRKRIKDPLNELIKVSIAVSDGDKSTRVKIKPGQVDDMRMVSQAFNNMLDNLQSANEELENWSQQLEYKVLKKSEELGAAQNELMHVERLASLGKLSSSVAHEINNPLSGILVYTKLLQKQLSNPETILSKREAMFKNLQLIESETKRCGDIVKGLLDFSRKDQDDFEPRHLHEILLETYNLMLHPISIANIRFLTDLTASADMVFCSPNQIKQACVALLVNSSEAVKENGEIVIRTRNAEPETVSFDISDTGMGIAPEDIPHIFEPFFSTKQDVRGIGLGLAIVHGIIQNHKGKIQVRSEVGKGTVITVTLPLIKN